MKKWCRHIVNGIFGFEIRTGTWKTDGITTTISSHWKCCPICGTRRPKATTKKKKVIAKSNK